MNFTPANLKMWSTIGSRATYGLVALELAKLYPDLILLTGDTSTSAGLDRFKKAFPEQYLDVGIAEQNMMGIAAGLASEGFRVFTSTFSPFQTLRAAEQIKVNLGYMRHPVRMVGLASGVVLGNLGYTHCSIEDLAVMRAIAGITILSPADCGSTVKAVMAAAAHNDSVYLRLTGGAKNPLVYEGDFDFQIGKANTLREGRDICLIATGTMVYESLRAAEQIAATGISVEVIDMHTIAPIDRTVIENAARKSRLIVTVEEHSVVGGLGSAVAEVKSTLPGAPAQLTLGLPARYGKASEYRSLLSEAGLTAPQIAEQVLRHYQNSQQISIGSVRPERVLESF